MYVPLHKVKIPPENLRRAYRALLLAIMSFIVFVAAKLLGALEVEYYAFQTSMVSLVLYLVLAVPFMMLAIGVLLSPMVIYLWLDSPSFRMIHQWWFWVHVIVAILAGAGLLSVAGKKYPKRDEY